MIWFGDIKFDTHRNHNNFFCRWTFLVCLWCCTSHSIKTQGQDPVALSFFIFSSLYSTPINNGWTSSPTRSVQSRLLSLSPQTADTPFLDLPFLIILVGVIVYAEKRTGWIRYDLFDWWWHMFYEYFYWVIKMTIYYFPIGIEIFSRLTSNPHLVAFFSNLELNDLVWWH